MTVFNQYARYYDLLYRDKEYAAEADYLHRLIQAEAPGAKTVLNLGCGSGRHDRHLAGKGYEVTGVDISAEMLSAARKAAVGEPRLSYVEGDARDMSLGRCFDVVLAVFHVMSYQVKNEEILAAFATARAHLKPGGAFIFDCWHGPGVLTDPPVVRVKELEDEQIAVTRIARPQMHPSLNAVDVNYLVFIKEKGTGTVGEVRETHRMRYLFEPEVELLVNASGFELTRAEEWLTGAPLSLSSWNALFACRTTVEGAAP